MRHPRHCHVHVDLDVSFRQKQPSFNTHVCFRDKTGCSIPAHGDGALSAAREGTSKQLLRMFDLDCRARQLAFRCAFGCCLGIDR